MIFETLVLLPKKAICLSALLIRNVYSKAQRPEQRLIGKEFSNPEFIF